MADRLADAVAEGANLSNSAARADLIRSAVQWLAEREAEVKALNAEINEYRAKHIKGDLGFKLADWNAIYRISQLSAEDRDVLLDTLHEGFAALGIHSTLTDDAVVAAGAMPAQPTAPPNAEARAAGRADGLAAVRDHAARYQQGEPGHRDYELGVADGQAERERAFNMGPRVVEELAEGGGESGASAGGPVPPGAPHSLNGAAEAAAPRRGRPRGSKNRPKPQDEAGHGGLDPAA